LNVTPPDRIENAGEGPEQAGEPGERNSKEPISGRLPETERPEIEKQFFSRFRRVFHENGKESVVERDVSQPEKRAGDPVEEILDHLPPMVCMYDLRTM
jgi:hypothetical protein